MRALLLISFLCIFIPVLPTHATEIKAKPNGLDQLDNLNLLEQLTPELHSSKSSVNDQLLNISQTIANQNYQKAIKELNQFQKRYPDNHLACYLNTLAHVGLSQWKKAEANVNQCIKINKSWPVLYTLKGAILSTLKNYPQALQQYNYAIFLEQQNPGPYLQRAKFYYFNHEHVENAAYRALNDIKTYHSLNGDARQSAGLLGLTYLRLGKAKLAKSALLEAIKYQPNNFQLIAQLVQILIDDEDFFRASTLLRGSHKQLTDNDDVKRSQLYLLQAKVAKAQNKTAQAETFFTSSLLANPNNMEARKTYMYFLDQQERLQEAIPLAKEGLEISPNDKYLTAYLAWALTDGGEDLIQASIWLKKAKQLDPTNVFLSDTEAWLNVQKQNYKQALKSIQPSLKYANTVPEIAYHASVINHKLGNKKQAIEFIKLALKADHSFNGRTEAEKLAISITQ